MTCALMGYYRLQYKVAGYTAMIFAGVYAVIILLIYFAQLTTVRLDTISVEAEQIIDYQKFGLFFSYNLLGYGLMALSKNYHIRRGKEVQRRMPIFRTTIRCYEPSERDERIAEVEKENTFLKKVNIIKRSMLSVKQ